MVVFAGNDVDLDLDDVVSHIEALLRRPPVLPVDLRGAYLPCRPFSAVPSLSSLLAQSAPPCSPVIVGDFNVVLHDDALTLSPLPVPDVPARDSNLGSAHGDSTLYVDLHDAHPFLPSIDFRNAYMSLLPVLCLPFLVFISYPKLLAHFQHLFT